MGLMDEFRGLSEADGQSIVSSYADRLGLPERTPPESVAYQLPFITGMISEWDKKLDEAEEKGKLSPREKKIMVSAISMSHLALVSFAEGQETAAIIPELGDELNPPTA